MKIRVYKAVYVAIDCLCLFHQIETVCSEWASGAYSVCVTRDNIKEKIIELKKSKSKQKELINALEEMEDNFKKQNLEESIDVIIGF